MAVTNREILGKLLELEVKIDVSKSVQQICHHCCGTGTKAVSVDETTSCPDCGGDGYIPFGRITLKSEE